MTSVHVGCSTATDMVTLKANPLCGKAEAKTVRPSMKALTFKLTKGRNSVSLANKHQHPADKPSLSISSGRLGPGVVSAAQTSFTLAVSGYPTFLICHRAQAQRRFPFS